MIPPHTRAVAFDAVGTLLFPTPGAPAVYEAAARRLGLPHDGLLEHLRDSYLCEEAIDRAAGWVTSEEREVARWRAIVAATVPGSGEDLFRELYEHFAGPAAWELAPDAGETIDMLVSSGYAVVLASNYDSRLDRVLDGHPALAPLRPALISAQIGVRKPGAAFFDKLAERLGVAAGEVLYVGDDYGNDFVGAGNAGMHAVLLDAGNRRPEVNPRISRLSELIGRV